MEQSIQTDTQASRIEREQDEATAREKARQKKEAARKKAASADNWLLSKISALSDGQAKGLVAANVAVVVALAGVFGYKAWGLHERGQFSWRTAGIGAGIVGVVGVVEGVFGRYGFSFPSPSPGVFTPILASNCLLTCFTRLQLLHQGPRIEALVRRSTAQTVVLPCPGQRVTMRWRQVDTGASVLRS